MASSWRSGFAIGVWGEYRGVAAALPSVAFGVAGSQQEVAVALSLPREIVVVR